MKQLQLQQQQQSQKQLKKVCSIFKNKIRIRNFYFLEVLIKPSEPNVSLSTIPSVDFDESTDISHRPLAPLASSETFTDVAALILDEQPKQETKTVSTTSNQVSSVKATKNEFDSLEKLFDFSSSGISNDTQIEIENSTQNSNHIRFSENNQIIRTDKVFDSFSFLFIKF